MPNLVEVIKQINKEKLLVKRRPRFKFILIAAAAVLVSAFYLTIFITSRMSWRAVFLTNNQVYFGHLFWNPLSQSAALTNIYYLQADQKLVKFGNELHSPRDKMIIPKRQILFWEDLKNDSLVVRKIKETNKR